MIRVAFLTKNRSDAVNIVENGFLGELDRRRLKLKKYIFPYNRQPVFSLLQVVNPWQVYKLFQLYRTSDIIHYSSFDIHFILYNLIFTKITRARTILTVYHLEMDSTNRLLDKVGLYKKIFLSFDSYVAISRYAKHQLIRLGVDSQKVTVSHPGVNKGITYSKTAPGVKYPYILFVGDEYPRKNLVTVLRAFAKLVKQFPHLYFIKIGVAKNKIHAQITDREIKKLSLEEKSDTYTKKKITNKNLSSYYSHAECLVSPSKMEGFGLPVLEASRCKCIPIVSSITPYKEFEQPAFLYVENINNASAWAKKIQSVLMLTSAEKARLKQAVFLRSKKYTWKQFARVVKKDYENK